MMPEVHQKDKKTLRQHFKQVRSQLSDEFRNEASKRILQFLLEEPSLPAIQTIHTFLSLPEEPDTHPVVEALWNLNKNVVVPCVQDKQTLGHSLLTNWQDVETGPYGIAEPAEEKRIPMNPLLLDWVLVPGLAFSEENGARLGYGKGFYDRFLKATPALLIGICFSCQLTSDLVQETHDVPVHAILTEKGWIYYCKK
ncbi:MAG: 5-formyltetrahydrofolate cyclo-ligase [SAR324 cluster bacterium]|nr:5-formyltetrahydrofolate cyclo-ligase [SAR324 cluster bacterium]